MHGVSREVEVRCSDQQGRHEVGGSRQASPAGDMQTIISTHVQEGAKTAAPTIYSGQGPVPM